MLISTMNDLPGYEVTEVLGEVFGITVRSRNVGSQIGAGLKSMMGGELKGMTKMLGDSRVEAQERLVEAAEQRGADAILAMRFDANDLMNIGQEICAYGTAVKIRKMLAGPPAGAIRTAGYPIGRSGTLQSAGDWLDPSTAWNNLTNATMTGTTWAQVATAAAVWVLLPVAVGGIRVLRSAVS